MDGKWTKPIYCRNRNDSNKQIKRASEKKEVLKDKEKKEYRALVGQLNWV